MALFGLSALFGRPKPRPLESQVLTAVAAELSMPAREIFNEQIEIVNLIQRHAADKEVNFYVMRGGKPVRDEKMLFPLRQEEVQLAKIEMVGGRAEVWLVKGRVFSIQFSKPPKIILEKGAKIEKVSILHDPMMSAPSGADSDAKLTTIHSKLPDEYTHLVGDGKKIRINDWAIHGVQDIRKIVQQDGNYYLLAEKEGMGVVGVKEDETTGQLYYLDYGDGRGEKISAGLKSFLEQFDGGKVIGRF
jgi:hypothetical protein